MWRAGNAPRRNPLPRRILAPGALLKANTVDARPIKHAAVLLAAAIALAASAGPVAAQSNRASPDNPATTEADPASAIQAPLVDRSHGKRAQAIAEQWVRNNAVPGPDTRNLPAIHVTGLFAVRVTLRLDGVPVGNGDAYRTGIDATGGEPDAPGPPVDLVSLLRPATQTAIDQLRESLRDAHLKAVTEKLGQQIGDDGDSDDPASPTVDDVAGRVLVDVQLAHQLEPIELDRNSDMTAPLHRFAPGFHGLRSPIDQGANSGAIVWPATALARHLRPRAQLIKLLDQRGRDAQAMVELGRPGGLPLQRFQVVHVVRPQPYTPATHLVRGNVVLPPRPIRSRTLDGMVARLGKHLRSRFTNKQKVRGTYHPTSNRYEPAVADDRAAALACYALMRHARRRGAIAGASDRDVKDMASAARQTAVTLGEDRVLAAQPRGQVAAAALVVLTLVDDPQPAEHKALRDELTAHIVSLRRQAGGFLENAGEDAKPVSPARRALALAALAAVYDENRDDTLAALLRQELAAMWAQLAQDPDVNALPWYMMAHHRAAHLLAENKALEQQLAKREKAMGELIARLCEQQVIERPVLGPADVVGGFELNTAPRGAPPSPDWRTAQVLSLLSVSLRQDGVTQDRDTIGWLLNAALAGRFVGQLMMDEASAYYARSVPDTVGGVRMALWDNRQPVLPTAMSLLACIQLQETLDHFSPRGE